ncbi:MAG: hypothetical protein RLZZ488_2071, partial [Pseudomonadota bacterium]
MKHTQFGSLIVTFAALNACGRTDVNLNSPALAGDTSSAAKEDS